MPVLGVGLLRGVDLPSGLPKLSVSASVKWQIFYHLVLTAAL